MTTVDSFEAWAGARQSMHENPGGDVQRIVWHDVYNLDQGVDITESLKSIDPDTREHLRRLLPTFPVGDLALSRTVLMPPHIGDIAFVDAVYSGNEPELSNIFPDFGSNLAVDDAGWHIDGTIPGKPPINNFTIQGSLDAQLLRVRDESRIQDFMYGDKPLESEIADIETMIISTGGMVTFQPWYDNTTPRYPDAHEFRTRTDIPRISRPLGFVRCNNGTTRILEALIDHIPALKPYHPDEIAARASKYV